MSMAVGRERRYLPNTEIVVKKRLINSDIL